MKKAIVAAITVTLGISLFACAPSPGTEVETAAASGDVFSALSSTAPEETPSVTPEASESASVVSTEAETSLPSASGPEMYTSYARLKSFDPSTGVAQFDYFDILRGDEAVDFLVNHEGYSQEDAQELVESFADSEYVEKNTNPQLRAIDIDGVSLSLMYQPSGAQVDGVEAVPSTASDFRAIYALDAGLLLNSFFFKIHVEDDGHVSLVEQVYWP